jgi:hypothetical protein
MIVSKIVGYRKVIAEGPLRSIRKLEFWDGLGALLTQWQNVDLGS